MPTRLSCLLALLLLLFPFAASAETASIAVGGIAIDYDPARWIATRLPNGGVNFACRGDDCRRARDGGHGVSVNARLAGMGTLTDSALDEQRGVRDVEPMWSDGFFRAPAPREFGGIAFTGYYLSSRCRAYTPMMQYAFGTHGERDYVFSAGFNLGCGGGFEGVSRERFRELLEGVRVIAEGGR